MKKLLIGIILGGFAVAPAIAADIPVKAPPPAAAPVYGWAGLYSGSSLGYGWGSTRWTFPATTFFNDTVPNSSISDNDVNGGLFGTHIGYNFQWNQIVAGVEASYARSYMRGRVIGGLDPDFPSDAFDTHVRDIVTVTGRLGYAVNHWLLYAKGGWATGRVKINLLSGPPVPNVVANGSEWLSGWTAGAGWEWMMHRNWSLGVEYNFVNLGADRFNLTAFPTATCLAFTPNTCAVGVNVGDIKISTVMLRLNYRYGADGFRLPWL